METEAEDNFVEELIAKMDTNVDGKIDYQEFVHFVRNCGTADILSTQTSRSSENNSPWFTLFLNQIQPEHQVTPNSFFKLSFLDHDDCDEDDLHNEI